MNKKVSALSISGSNSKVVAKEVFNSFYELTKEKPDNKNQKQVSQSDTEKCLEINSSDITRTFIADMFADLVDSSKSNSSKVSHSLYNTWDIIHVPANNLYEGQSSLTTTIGRYITNKFVLQGSGVISETKYINKVLNKSGLGNLDNMIGRLYLEDKITRAQFNSYIDRRDTLGYWANGMLAHTISEKMMKPLPEIEKKKAELIKKYEKELKDGNVDVMTKISDELVAYAKELLKNDPGMDLYDSGDLDFSNNYKNNSIVKGAVLNKLTDEFDFIGSSFMDGIEIEDLPAHANSILASQYPASISTQDSGYMSKKLLALMQMMQVDEPGTDCGTKRLIPIKITNKNKNDVLYTYIKEGESLIMLDANNINSYVGKTVMMRTPMTCIGDKVCSVCAGKLFEYLGIKDAGLYSVQLAHSSLNLGLKQKHNSTINLSILDPNDIIEDI